jgi:hypothetical protein
VRKLEGRGVDKPVKRLNDEFGVGISTIYY